MTPTKPGHYWWRAKDEDEWVIAEVILKNSRLNIRCQNGDCLVSAYGGQWVSCHNPGEGVEGVEGWGVFEQGAKIPCFTGSTEQEAITTFVGPDNAGNLRIMMWEYAKQHEGYTCKPITIHPREEG